VITDGVEALRGWINPYPDPGFTGSHLPHVEGDEFLRMARVNPSWKDVPIYIITADAKTGGGLSMEPRVAKWDFPEKAYYSIDLLQELLEKYVQS